MAVYGYTRVSTRKQLEIKDKNIEQGESLETQQRRIEGYAMSQGLTLDSMFIEKGVSGSVPIRERKEGQQLLALLQPGDVIITPKLDRMFRSALDALGVLADLQKAGISLHMIDLGGDVTGNGISKLVFTILSAVAEAERDRIRERITEVKADQRRRGRFLGGTVPFGFTRAADDSLQPNPREQAAIGRIKALRDAGESLRAIAAAMACEGFKISHQGVKNVLDAATPPKKTVKAA
jgi:DNA invertase Pin-like site-specific DNA recombinase